MSYKKDWDTRRTFQELKKNSLVTHRVFSLSRFTAGSFAACNLWGIEPKNMWREVFENQLIYNLVSESAPLRGEKENQATPIKRGPGTTQHNHTSITALFLKESGGHLNSGP